MNHDWNRRSCLNGCSLPNSLLHRRLRRCNVRVSVVTLALAGLAFPLTSASLPLQAQSSIVYAPASDATDTPANEPAPEVVEMQKVTDRWDDAVLQRDPYALEMVLSPSLVDISSSGQTITRDQLVSLITQKNSPVRTLDQTVTNVRLLGDIAIVTGTYDVKFRPDEEHRPQKDETGIYSQVYQRLHTTWVCIHSQRTTLTATSNHPGDKSDKNNKKEKQKEARNDAAPTLSFPGTLSR